MLVRIFYSGIYLLTAFAHFSTGVTALLLLTPLLTLGTANMFSHSFTSFAE